MPFAPEELQQAHVEYLRFKQRNPPLRHERYIFPFFAGSYFTYRKIDVLRVIQIAKAISDEPKYVDVGCGYGDFLKKVREFLPDAIGIEKEPSIFYLLGKTRPDYIYPYAIEWFEGKRFDMAYVGWMDHGVDFRRSVANTSKCVLTTFDSGGQCGVNGECEYDEFGFHRIASWKTPSWIDVNTELMNTYYTPSLKIDEPTKRRLSTLRTAHNLWYLYAKPEFSEKIINALKQWLITEEQAFAVEKFDFESILDECGFYYMKHLPTMTSKDKRLWELTIDE
jgi:SAM-dependent methyltransferase